jgi:hypothetical protein
MIHTTSVDLFAGIPVADYTAALEWYKRLLGSEPTFLAHAGLVCGGGILRE